MDYKNKEEIYNKLKERIERSINYYKIRIESWQNVKRIYKKDGSDFKNLSQNFANCKIEADSLNDYEIKIYFKDENGYTTYDYIRLDLEENNKEEIKKEENQEFYKKYSFSENYFFRANAKQTEQLIKIRIETYKNLLQQNIDELKRLDKIFEEFYSKTFNLLNFLEEIDQHKTDINKVNTLYYAIKEILSKLYIY